jgi:hypothetical protein
LARNGFRFAAIWDNRDAYVRLPRRSKSVNFPRLCHDLLSPLGMAILEPRDSHSFDSLRTSIRPSRTPRIDGMAFPNPEYQNSAGRLLALLSVIPKNKNLLESLPLLFGAAANSMQQRHKATMSALVDLHNLYMEFREDMMGPEINEKQRNVILGGLVALEDSLSPIALNTSMRPVGEAEAALLRVAATLLPEDGLVTDDDLRKIRESTSKLRSLVEQGDISPTLRKALLELIRLSEDAISRFNIHGPRGLKKAFKSMLAEAAELYGFMKSSEEQGEPSQSTTWSVIVCHLKMFDEIAARIMKYRPLIESSVPLLISAVSSVPVK